MDLKVKITHSVYRPFDIHVSGEELSQIEMSEITRPAAGALNRESGYFFETIDDRLVFGFLTEWDQQAGASRGGEFFFNIFTMDKQRIQNIDLHKLKQQLESVAVRSPKNPLSDHSTISLKEVDEPSYNKINNIIFQWQKYGKAKANLSEVSSLISGIPESIEYIKYVSKINNDSGGDHYNVYKGGRSTDIRSKRSITDGKPYLSEIKKQSEKVDRNRKMLQYLIYITLFNLIFIFLLILSSIVYFLYFFDFYLTTKIEPFISPNGTWTESRNSDSDATKTHPPPRRCYRRWDCRRGR